MTIDADGFVAIRGRAKRFAKIAGEMVSLSAVETLASDLWPGHLAAVTAITDPRKGEKLIMITDAPGATRKDFLSFAKSKGAQDLMVPAEVRICDVPLLGTGKVDFTAVTKLVMDETSAAAR